MCSAGVVLWLDCTNEEARKEAASATHRLLGGAV
jgi:hypothetical protein